MKNKKISLIFVPLLSAGVLTGCFGRGGEEQRDVDLSKTQLHVAAIRSGVEDGWLQDIAARFTEKYADYSFEEGKTGIQVWVDGDKTAYNGDQLVTKIKTDDHQVYCVENVKYNDFVNPEQLVMNLKDIINVKGSDGNPFYTEEKSILDRMDPQFRRTFEKSNGDIFMIPYYESFATFQYDRDVFNDPSKGTKNKSLYLKRSDLAIQSNPMLADYYADVEVAGSVAPLYDEFTVDPTFPLDSLFCDKDEDATHRNYGPDGIQGTFDDGLPQTFTEFKVLVEYMKHFGYEPILGNSTYNYYFADMLASFWANEEGIDGMNLNFSWEGTASNLIKIQDDKVVRDGDGNLVYDAPTAISKSNAVELHRQEGVYRALEFSKILADIGPNNNNAFTAAQRALIDTKFNTTKGFDYGLLCDGNWWENESKESFAPKSTDPRNRSNRNFSFFTFPKSSSAKWDSTRGDMTFYNINSSTCFINKATPSNLVEAAKAFFYYINSNEGMSAFTTSTSMTRPFEYTLTESDSAKVAPYGKDMMKLRSYFSDTTGVTKNYNICTTYPLSDVVASNEGKVHKYEWNFQLKGAAKDKAIPVDQMMKEGYSVDKYFVDSYNYLKSLAH